jgi:urease accessory protein
MMKLAELLTVLQYGDSFFPSGAFASSWGLETLQDEGKVSDRLTLTRFIAGQLRLRWARCDRLALSLVYRAGDALESVAHVDAEVEALSLARDQREASRRAGRALLRVHAQLGTPHAAAYLAWITQGKAYGHVPIIQGLVWRGVGLSEEWASALSGQTQCLAFVSAALRLGMISHIEAQQIQQQLRETLLEVLQSPLPAMLSSFAPAADIAMMRHETQSVRLFAS